mgnify:CR=1 FL=1
MHSNKRFILGMFKAGAYGYLLKDSDSSELIEAIKKVAQNKKYISQRISGAIVDELISPTRKEETELSQREKEILQLIAEGKSSKEIADILFVSSKTVDSHRKNIMDKLELYNIPDLTKYAIKTGLTTLDDWFYDFRKTPFCTFILNQLIIFPQQFSHRFSETHLLTENSLYRLFVLLYASTMNYVWNNFK